jgi:hypothetical protein
MAMHMFSIFGLYRTTRVADIEPDIPTDRGAGIWSKVEIVVTGV